MALHWTAEKFDVLSLFGLVPHIQSMIVGKQSIQSRMNLSTVSMLSEPPGIWRSIKKRHKNNDSAAKLLQPAVSTLRDEKGRVSIE